MERVLFKLPGEEANIKYLSDVNSLEELEKLLGYECFIEIIHLAHYERESRYQKSYVLIVDDSGKLKNLEANITVGTGTVIVGPIIFSKIGNDGNLAGLDDKDINCLSHYLRERTT